MASNDPHQFLVGYPSIPPGGVRLTGRVLGPSETPGTSQIWMEAFTPVFDSLYGVELVPGSLNLRLPGSIEWEDPFVLDIGGRHWEFCPVVLDEKAVGVVFRADRLSPDLLEIASTVHLRSALGGVADGAMIAVRLLPGWDLRPAA